MLRILVAVDGSESSDRAVAHLLKKLGWYKEKIEVHLLNVQAALPSQVGLYAPAAEQLQGFHREQGEAALASARAILDGAKVGYVTHIGIGEPAHVIAHYAKEKSVDQIVMGARGLGSIAGLVMGSVTTKVLGLTDVPVLVIK
ncbi:MAG TPA: universal stress protein [Usitatibacteraceae bacterium]|nr:universal stress protein [Usitatibacteraceae bacterium]